ncbi:alkaline phosphatase family protein, partial [Burkholderia multivorans]
VYLYWGNLDKTGHVSGSNSANWSEELERIDGALSRLAQDLPHDSALVVTADHGMVDIDHDRRLDLVDAPDLKAGLRHLGGEPQAPPLHAQLGDQGAVAAARNQNPGER